jgi:hypothetical protein
MTEHPVPEESERAEPPVDEARESVEAYEAEGGVVLYDAQAPLAWIQATNAVPLADCR